MAQNFSFGITLKADGSAAIGAIELTKKQFESLGESAEKTSASFGKTRAGIESISAQLASFRTLGISTIVSGEVLSQLSNLKTNIIDASLAAERLQSVLGYSQGGLAGASEATAFLKKLTNDLGLEFRSTADAFGKFSAAAKTSGMAAGEVQRIFTSTTKATAAMGLSVADTQGVLLALQQMMSKGNVQAEELRGQLGERLPGAFALAAKAMQVTEAELGKMLERGEVAANVMLPKLATEMERAFGSTAAAASQNAQAAFNRLTNSLNELFATIGKSGALDFFARSADSISSAIAGITPSIAAVTPYIFQFVNGLVSVASAALLLAPVAATLVGVAAALPSVAAGFLAIVAPSAAAAIGIGGVTLATGGLSAAVATLGALIVAHPIVAIAVGAAAVALALTELAERFEGVRRAMELIGYQSSETNRVSREAIEGTSLVVERLGQHIEKGGEKTRYLSREFEQLKADWNSGNFKPQQLEFRIRQLIEKTGNANAGDPLAGSRRSDGASALRRSDNALFSADTEMMRFADKFLDSYKSKRQKYNDELLTLDGLRAAGLIASEAQYFAAKKQIQEKYLKSEAGAARQVRSLDDQLFTARVASERAQNDALMAMTKAVAETKVVALKSGLDRQLMDQVSYESQVAAIRLAALDRERALASETLALEKQKRDAFQADATGATSEKARYEAAKQLEASQQKVISAEKQLIDLDEKRAQTAISSGEAINRALEIEANALAELARWERERIAMVEDLTRAQDAQLRQLDLEIALVGKSAAEQAKLKKEFELQNALREEGIRQQRILNELMSGQGKSPEQSDRLNQQLKDSQARTEALRTQLSTLPEAMANKTALKEAADAWQNTSITIRDGLTTALEDWAMRGKSLGASLRDQLKQMFAQPIRQVLQFVSSGITGMLGLGGGGAQASPLGALGGLFGGGGGGGGAGGLLNSVSSLFGGGAGFLPSLVQGAGSLFGGAFSSLSATTAAFVDSGMTYAAALSSAGSAVGGFAGTMGSLVGGMAAPFSTLGTAMSSGIAAAGGFAATLGAAIPIIGGIVALASALGAFKNKTGLRINAGTQNRDGTSAQASEVRESALGRFYIEGDLKQSLFDPFAKKITELDALIVSAFLKPEQMAAIRRKVEGLVDPAWIGFKDEASFKEAFEKGGKGFLSQRFGAIFDEIDSTVAGLIRNFGGSADELLQFVAAAVESKAVVDALNAAVPDLNLALGRFLGYSKEQREQLVKSADAFVALRQALPQVTLSLEAFAFAGEASRATLISLADTWRISMQSLKTSFTEAMANVGRTDWSRLFAARGELLKAAQSFDGSAQSAQRLAAMSAARYQAEVAMLQRIAGLIVEINAQFRDDVTSILDAGRTKEQNFEQNRNRADAAARGLKDPTTLTQEDKALLGSELGLDASTDFEDPEVIAKLAAYGRKAINEAFAAVMSGIEDGTITEAGMTKDQTRAKYAAIYAGKQAEMGNAATGSLTDSGTTLAEGGEALNKLIRDAIEKPINDAAAKMNEAADKMAAAAQTMKDAAETPKDVVVTVNNSGGGSGGDDQVVYYGGA
jgi:tape measure domain-containing protein